MNCQNCGKPLLVGARFCASCGTPVAAAEASGSKPTEFHVVGDVMQAVAGESLFMTRFRSRLPSPPRIPASCASSS